MIAGISHFDQTIQGHWGVLGLVSELFVTAFAGASKTLEGLIELIQSLPSLEIFVIP